MSTRSLVWGLSIFFLAFTSCGEKTSTVDTLIPLPVTIEKKAGAFAVNAETTIYADTSIADVLRLAGELAAKVQQATGWQWKVNGTNSEGMAKASAEKNAILLMINPADAGSSHEGYSLNISETNVVLSASHSAGIFYGLQTMRQLFPHEIEKAGSGQKDWSLPAVAIKDYPEYAYRGSMLDVSRHFFGVEEIKHFIDLLSFYKMNILHLHLSDDQGWRIEIKSWPNLTAHGGSSQVGGAKGGFYTQEEYKDIVKYAAEHYVTVIPEIDMPGHTNAALASYAELNCNDTATQLYIGTEVGFSTLCTRKEVTYRFLDSVIRELAAITPGQYLHIGGDESHSTPIEDYIPFMERVQQIVKKYGKTAIGWDEIANCQLEPGTLAQYWAEEKNAQMAVSKGAQLIMSPAHKIYMDMQYDSTTKLGLHWAGFIEVDSAYIWNPTTVQEGVERKNIMGVEAPLWSETLVTRQDIEYMMFPRFPGYAEIAWSPKPGNWDDYKKRLAHHSARMDALGITYYRSPKVPWPAK